MFFSFGDVAAKESYADYATLAASCITSKTFLLATLHLTTSQLPVTQPTYNLTIYLSYMRSLEKPTFVDDGITDRDSQTGVFQHSYASCATGATPSEAPGLEHRTVGKYPHCRKYTFLGKLEFTRGEYINAARNSLTLFCLRLRCF